jgi:hypothetical protein
MLRLAQQCGQANEAERSIRQLMSLEGNVFALLGPLQFDKFRIAEGGPEEKSPKNGAINCTRRRIRR